MAAHLSQHWGAYTGNAAAFDDAQGHLLTLRNWDLRGRVIRRSLFWWPIYALSLRFPRHLSWCRVGRTELLQSEYDRFFSGQTLLNLRKQGRNSPTTHIISTNLKTGGLCSFTNDKYLVFTKIGQETYHAELTPLSLAVTASSAFPPIFPPISFDEGRTGEKAGTFHVSPHVLTDGGVYDNTGFASAAELDIQRQRNNQQLSDLILVSDAGTPFQYSQNGTFTNPLSLAFRSSEIIMNRVAEDTLRRIASEKRVGLVSIDNVEENDVLPPMVQKAISQIRTDLDRFSDPEVSALVAHGENRLINFIHRKLGITADAATLNPFPIPLPASHETLAKALARSWKVRWWNTFTNFADFLPTVTLNGLFLMVLSGGLFSIYLIVGIIYLDVVTPLRTPTTIHNAEASVSQSPPIISPLEHTTDRTLAQSSHTPSVAHTTLSTRCTDAIDTTLPLSQVVEAARECMQKRR